MIDLLTAIFTNKQLFTVIILVLYASNFLFQMLVTKDYIWGLYWMFAAGITVTAALLSSRAI